MPVAATRRFRHTPMSVQQNVNSETLGDLLERVLDKGLVIAGDIKIKLVDIELLTIQLRLVVASVEKAKEIGLDWWEREPAFSSAAAEKLSADAPDPTGDALDQIQARLAQLEARTPSSN